MIVSSLNHFKAAIAHQFFVAPGDSDYLIARWLLMNGFQPEVFWHVAQTFEKYLKAGLVLNEIEVRTQNSNGHDLNSLYEKHVEIFGDIAFVSFHRPDSLNPEIWRDETVSSFISRIALIGSPDSRYGLVSWDRYPDDLFKIDQACWSLRRLTIGLDWSVGGDVPCDSSMAAHRGKTYREALRADVDVSPRGPMKAGEGSLVDIGQNLDDLFHSWNFSHRRCQADLFKPASAILASRIGPFANSYVLLLWEMITATDKRGKLKPLPPHMDPGLRWLIRAIKLPRGVKEEFEAQLAKPRGL
jgi:hypothetical protein